MLTAFNERVAGFKALVSFFGKNFDRYRLEDRMAALGIESALPLSCHLDLFHVGRRLYKGRFEDLRLKTLEERGELEGCRGSRRQHLHRHGHCQ